MPYPFQMNSTVLIQSGDIHNGNIKNGQVVCGDQP